MTILIVAPERSVMQSARSGRWLLIHEPKTRPTIDPLTGSTGTSEPTRQLRLWFDNRKDAVQYAERTGLPYKIREQKQESSIKKSYAENFAANRSNPWTH